MRKKTPEPWSLGAFLGEFHVVFFTLPSFPRLATIADYTNPMTSGGSSDDASDDAPVMTSGVIADMKTRQKDANTFWGEVLQTLSRAQVP